MLNPRPAGVASRTRIAGGVIFAPPDISGTKGRRRTRRRRSKCLAKTILSSA